MRPWLLVLMLGLSLAGGCVADHAHAQTGVKSMPSRADLPERVGSWKLARFVPGENAHFLYVQGRRSFSLFVTELKSQEPLTPRQGWKKLLLPGLGPAFLHADPRDPSRAAIAWGHASQRRILIGRLSEKERTELATQLR